MITLRETREQKVGSLSKLAEKSDLNAGTIWRIETGKVTPTFGTVNKLCGALEVLPHQVSEFHYVEMPGDPCPCECGNFRGPDGRVVVVCQFCGKSRTDEHLKNHPKHCRSCAKAINNPMYPKALEIIRIALARLGITLKEACTKAGINATSPSLWIRKVRTPRRESLQALADVLGTPELMDAIPCRTDWYLLTCRCGKTVWRRACVIKRRQVRKGCSSPYQSSYVWDPKTGTGTYVCSTCFDNPVMKQRWANEVKKKGRPKAEARLAELREMRDPKWSDTEYLREAIKVAQEAVRGTQHTEKYKNRIGAALKQPLPSSREPTLCPVCGALHVPKRQKGTDYPLGVHGPCWNWWRSENMDSFSHQNSYPLPGDGPEYSTDQLKNMVKLTWRHVVLGEEVVIKEAIKKDGADWLGLAKEFSVSKRTAYRWIHFILDHLPTVHRPPWERSDMDWLYARGGPWLTERSEILTACAVKMGLMTPVNKEAFL